jgi:hypothetical protein
MSGHRWVGSLTVGEIHKVQSLVACRIPESLQPYLDSTRCMSPERKQYGQSLGFNEVPICIPHHTTPHRASSGLQGACLPMKHNPLGYTNNTVLGLNQS